MYAIKSLDSDFVGEQGRMRGPGVKSQERLAIESLVPGTMVSIPRSAAKQGSISAWAINVGREKGHKIKVRRTPDNWILFVDLM